jgi:hypothetical protein
MSERLEALPCQLDQATCQLDQAITAHAPHVSTLTDTHTHTHTHTHTNTHTHTHTYCPHSERCSYFLVSGVKPSLHTPLMSMSNAISGIVILGGMVMIQGEYLDDTDGNPTQVRCSGHTVFEHVGLGPLLWAHCR